MIEEIEEVGYIIVTESKGYIAVPVPSQKSTINHLSPSRGSLVPPVTSASFRRKAAIVSSAAAA